jgi:hypothetical protein
MEKRLTGTAAGPGSGGSWPKAAEQDRRQVQSNIGVDRESVDKFI